MAKFVGTVREFHDLLGPRIRDALEHDGGVEYHELERYCEDELGVPTFYPAFAQMKTDAANSHGKVFYVKGMQVRMWSQARAEVDKYFDRVGATRDCLV